MGHFATGLAIVTGSDDGSDAGLVVNSFTSVSLTPPLILFCAAHTSTSWPVLRRCGAFCVNVLARDHQDLARSFFAKHPDRFAAASWRTEHTGAPVLDGALLWLDCRLQSTVPAGDHDIAIGEVLAFGGPQADDEPPEPLLFYRGEYATFRSPAGPNVATEHGATGSDPLTRKGSIQCRSLR
jgi:3-hydroxy-9,10-secoandrosta-1,3,5(10)-triene-9,17-dione monooxygenase reductase component